MNDKHDHTNQIFESANNLHKEVTHKMLKYLKEYKDYKIFVTGHSLGAGVCSLLGLIWKSQNVFTDDQFKCFSFASPLVIGKDGVKKSLSSKNMISVAVTSDIITRLSIKGVEILKRRLDVIGKNENEYSQLCKSMELKIENGNDIGKAEKDSLAPLIYIDEEEENNNNIDLYPAGRVLWSVPEFIVDDIKKGRKYKKLLQRIDQKTSSWKIFRYIETVYTLMSDFLVTNNGEELCEIKGDHDDIYDRFEFTQMVIHDEESFIAHLPGRYINGFDLGLMDVIRLTKFHGLLYNLLQDFIPTVFIDILLLILIVNAYFLLRIVDFFESLLNVFYY